MSTFLTYQRVVNRNTCCYSKSNSAGKLGKLAGASNRDILPNKMCSCLSLYGFLSVSIKIWNSTHTLELKNVMDMVKTALFKENILNAGWAEIDKPMVPFTPLLELNNWWANLKSGFRPPHVPQMQHVDIKQSLNEISLLQLILSIKNLNLSSIDLYENKDRKKVLIYRQSDGHQIRNRPDFFDFLIFFLFVGYIKLPWRAPIEKPIHRWISILSYLKKIIKHN